MNLSREQAFGIVALIIGISIAGLTATISSSVKRTTSLKTTLLLQGVSPNAIQCVIDKISSSCSLAATEPKSEKPTPTKPVVTPSVVTDPQNFEP